jgi:hypothetical protein
MEALKYPLLVAYMGSYTMCIRLYVHLTRDTAVSMYVTLDVADDLCKGRKVEGVGVAHGIMNVILFHSAELGLLSD